MKKSRRKIYYFIFFIFLGIRIRNTADTAQYQQKYTSIGLQQQGRMLEEGRIAPPPPG